MRKTSASANFQNKSIEDLNPFILIRKLNSTRVFNHSANKVQRDDKGNIIAVRCNCGKSIYHPVINGEVKWMDKIPGNYLPTLKKIGLKGLWILED